MSDAADTVSAGVRTPQFWLAELDQYGNPKLVDGPHGDREGPIRALRIMRKMALCDPNQEFAIAAVHLSPMPTAKGRTFDEKMEAAAKRAGG